MWYMFSVPWFLVLGSWFLVFTPRADPMPTKGAAFSVAAQQAVLHMLLQLWPHSVSFPALRQEMSGRIRDAAQSITTAPEKKDARHSVRHVLFKALSSNAANGTPRFHRRRATAGGDAGLLLPGSPLLSRRFQPSASWPLQPTDADSHSSARCWRHGQC